MNKTIIRRGQSIAATEDTPLYACELGLFMGWSRATVYRHIEQGYRFEYGRTTTPRHYRRWMKKRASFQQAKELAESKAVRQRLERELLELQ